MTNDEGKAMMKGTISGIPTCDTISAMIAIQHALENAESPWGRYVAGLRKEVDFDELCALVYSVCYRIELALSDIADGLLEARSDDTLATAFGGDYDSPFRSMVPKILDTYAGHYAWNDSERRLVRKAVLESLTKKARRKLEVHSPSTN